MPATNQQKHDAGRHLLVAEALLRGYDARTVGRSGLVEVNGHEVEVHVKTKGVWQIGNIYKFAEATTERVVFVDVTETGPEFYILDGDGAGDAQTELRPMEGEPPGRRKASHTGQHALRGPN